MGSAVPFGEPKIRYKIVLSFGAVRSNPCRDRPCGRVADAEIVDSITLLGPPWESAVEGGVNHGGLGFALKSRSRSELSAQLSAG